MIVVLLGTNPYSFTRLLRAVDAWSLEHGEKVVAQTGYTPTEGLHIECHSFVSHEQILNWLAMADIAICQGGFGSIRDCLRMGKPTIAVPRYPELGESRDHQSELVSALAAENRVIPLEDIRDLPDAIDQAQSWPATPNPESRIPEIVARSIDQVLGST